MEPLPLSLLNDFLYCPRRAALKEVEGWREANEHTERGDIIHEHADLPGYESQISNLKSQIHLLRALPVFSERLGLSGKCDIVEVELRSGSHFKSQISNLKSGDIVAMRPVEYKKGKRRQFENDDAQLCAQALCLEKMFGLSIAQGAVFHAESKRRREVPFTPELRRLTEQAIAEMREILDSALRTPHSALPQAVFKPACEQCSLYKICLPQVTSLPARLERAHRELFEI
jgi:CRISPR-associated exonuclease Cas4